MKTSKLKIEDEDLIESSEGTLDPYAVDFFGVPNTSGTDSKQTAIPDLDLLQDIVKKPEKIPNIWFKNLPSISVDEVNFSNQISGIPLAVSRTTIEGLKNVFSRFTKIDTEHIGCEILNAKEVNLSESVSGLKQNPNIFLTFQNNPHSYSSIAAIETVFTSSIIDMVLGGTGKGSDTLDSISMIEKTILEFLTINVFSELNNILDDLKLSLQNVSNTPLIEFENAERGVELKIDIKLAKITGSILLLCPLNFLKTFENAENSLLTSDGIQKRFNEIGKIIDNFRMNVLLAETQINADELSFLEIDDVILIEKSYLNSQNISQELNSVYVGDSSNFRLEGNVQNIVNNDDLSEEMLFEIQEIISVQDANKILKREKMDKDKKKETDTELSEAEEITKVSGNEIELIRDGAEEESFEDAFDEEIDEETLATLENIMINLRVNLGGRRLSLSELQKIRVGQIIELGCRPNDPVEIVTDSDSKPIATGELMEIEGQLGVRLTKILI